MFDVYNGIIMFIPTQPGFSVTTPSCEIICKVRLLMCSADLPARASVLNMKKFNGAYGCSQCEDKGQPRTSSHLHRNWPCTTPCVAHTHESVVLNAKDSLRTKEAVSVLSTLHYVNDCFNVYIFLFRLKESRELAC